MKLEAIPGAPQDGDLEFVLATEKEFEEIVSMSHGIYGGLDYLPSRYHSWVNEKDRMVVLAKKKGDVVRMCHHQQTYELAPPTGFLFSV